MREELKLVKVKGWQAAAGNSGCPSRAVGRVGRRNMGPPQEGEAGPLPGAGNEVRKHFK